MTHLTGIDLLCDGRAVRAVVHGTISGAHGRHRAQQPGLRWARSARRTSLQHLTDTLVSRGAPRLAERADLAHQMGHYQRTLV
jgi:hypothetical protein